MAIYTSRYSNKKLLEDGYYPVGISVGSPKFNAGYTLREKCYALAPTGQMLRLDYEPYRKQYMEKLNRIGADKIISIVNQLEMRALDEGKELVLLCFEDIRNGDNWCHRTLFAEWWMERTGEIIAELEDPSPVKPANKPVTTVPAAGNAGKKPEKVEPCTLPPEEYIQMRLY